MAEFKFSCPQCGQHIQCDTGYAGAQINCPSCNQSIVVPPAPPSPASPPPAPVLATQRPTAAPSVPAAGMRAAVPPPVPQKKSGVMKTVLVICSAVAALAVLAGGGWYGWHSYSQKKAKKGNPEAQVAVPTADSTMQALGILSKVHSAYTNLTSVRADGTFTMSLNVSNITMADVNPKLPADAKNANRHPQGMPRMITDTTEVSVRRAQPAYFYVVAESVVKIDRQTVSNTFAIWKSDQGQFMFSDNHQKMLPPTYRQTADGGVTNAEADQFKKMQELFADPANLSKIIKDLGQTGDESVNGQDCYTLTAKVIGQKVKVWVDKTTYLIPQWQVTLGGAISDADIDDAFSLYETAFTNMPPTALDMIKTQVKTFAPVMAKIRGTLTSTSKDVEINPSLSADDFNYDVPPGVRLVRMPGAGAATGNLAAARARSQQNACINNLRQIDAAKNEFALEKGKKNGDDVAEADITTYLKGGILPTCPSGGTYTIGKVGDKPTCSIPGHALP
jgi:outer membrane lipoprotein-sorting protein/DNA-directed RNA polymerase subunit RPC12/RpoP